MVRCAPEYLKAHRCAINAVSWTLAVCPRERDERASVDVGNGVRDRCGGRAERAGWVRVRIAALSHHVQVRNARCVDVLVVACAACEREGR